MCAAIRAARRPEAVREIQAEKAAGVLRAAARQAAAPEAAAGQAL